MYLVLIHSVSIKITKPSKNLVLSFKRQSDQIKSKSFEVIAPQKNRFHIDCCYIAYGAT